MVVTFKNNKYRGDSRFVFHLFQVGMPQPDTLSSWTSGVQPIVFDSRQPVEVSEMIRMTGMIENSISTAATGILDPSITTIRYVQSPDVSHGEKLDLIIVL